MAALRKTAGVLLAIAFAALIVSNGGAEGGASTGSLGGRIFYAGSASGFLRGLAAPDVCCEALQPYTFCSWTLGPGWDVRGSAQAFPLSGGFAGAAVHFEGEIRRGDLAAYFNFYSPSRPGDGPGPRAAKGPVRARKNLKLS